MNKSIKYLFFTLFPLSILNAQPDLSGTVTFPDSVGIDLISVEVWQNNQQIANTITDSLGYFELDSIITSVNNTNSISPSSFELYPNYPSPFDKKTNIIYEVNEPEEISITIYNSIGQKITTLTSGYKQKGFYVAQWNGRNSFGNEVAQGIYFARLDNGKDAKYIKVLKMNGSLNAIGTSIPGGFYTSYKGSKINEDYLIKFIDINIVNRVDYAEITVSLPAQIQQVLTEEFSYTGPSQLIGDEGEQIAVAKSWFNYGTRLDTIELMNTNVWEIVNATLDSLYFATIDTTLNGQIPLELKTTSLHETNDTATTQVTLADIVTISGKIIDNDLYINGDGPAHPGILDYLGERTVFTNGIYTIRVPAQDSIDILTTPINAVGDTVGWTSTHTIPANTDQTGIILHPVTNNTIEGLELLFKEFYEIVNDNDGGFGYFGKKYIDQDNPETNIYWIGMVSPQGDTTTVADQDSVENYLINYMIPGQQKPMGIYKATLQDTIDYNASGGRIYIFIEPNGNASGGGIDIDSDGKIDRGVVYLPKLNGQFYWPWAAQEIFTPEAGPNELDDPRFNEYSVLQSSNPFAPIELQIFDKKLRRIGENYPPKEKKSRIFGGAKFN